MDLKEYIFYLFLLKGVIRVLFLKDQFLGKFLFNLWEYYDSIYILMYIVWLVFVGRRERYKINVYFKWVVL